MWSFFNRYRGPLLVSLGLHAVLGGMLTFSLSIARPYDVQPPPLAVRATVVDADRIQQELDKIDQAERAAEIEQTRRAEEATRRAEQARRDQQQEQQRLADLKQQQEAQRQRDREEAIKREADLKRQQETERQRIAELERQRKAEEQRLALLAEQRREEEDRRRKAEAEAQARAAREAQLRREIGAEEERRTQAQASAVARYKALLQQRVQRNWLKPANTPPGLDCEVQVSQLPDGSVIDVRVLSCNGDAAVRRSIEIAVNRSSPLPLPEDRSVFERQLIFNFKPQD